MKIFTITRETGRVADMRTAADDAAPPGAPWKEESAEFVAAWEAANRAPESPKEEAPEQVEAALLEKKAAIEAELAKVEAELSALTKKPAPP